MQLKNAIIFLVGYSAFAVMLNASGIFMHDSTNINLQHQNISTLNSSYVTDLTDVPSSASAAETAGGVAAGFIGAAAGFAFSMFTSLFSWVFTIVGVQPMLIAMGIPLQMAIMLESMLMLTAVIALIFIVANRSDKGVS